MKSKATISSTSIRHDQMLRVIFKFHWLSLLLAAATSFPVFAQQPLSLEQAVQTALQNNQGIKASEYQVDYFREVKKTSTDVGKLSALWMHGQYNSIYQDNNLTLMQTLPFPTVFGSQLKLGEEQILGAEKELQSAKNNLVFEVKSIYFQLLYVQSLKELLRSQDSLYSDFANASSLRYATGESNLLEKTTAEMQRMEIKNQEHQNESDILICQTRLRALLKSDAAVTSTGLLEKRDLPLELDTASLLSNPQLGFLQQQTRISEQTKRVERNRILPDISVGYFVQSLTGLQNVNGQDTYFNRSRPFQGFELGIAVPLWLSPQLAKVRAAGVHEKFQRKNAEYYQTTLLGAYSQALQELEKNRSSLNYYETTALQNAQLILTQAHKAYKGGEIGYIEYGQAVKNANAIKSNFLQVLNLYNQSVLKIEFLLGKY